jgi:hypothetical protein
MQPASRHDAAAGRVFLLGALLLLCVLASETHGAETSAPARAYAFELHTLNLGDKVRRGQIEFNIDNGMTEDELESVRHVLDQLGASRVDDNGYRELSLSNGTRLRIGGFLVEGFLEDSVEGVHSLPVECSVKSEFSTVEAALILRIATAGNLSIDSSDPDRVATTARVTDRRFLKLHKQVSITPDETALAEWIRQNITARDVPDEGRR